MVFFVKYAGGCGHPLHVAFTNNSTAAAAIVMGHATFVSDGYGFKTTVGMHAHPSGCIGGCKFMLGIIIHHNERIGTVHIDPMATGYKGVHPKTIPNKMGFWGCHNEFNLFLIHIRSNKLKV